MKKLSKTTSIIISIALSSVIAGVSAGEMKNSDDAMKKDPSMQQSMMETKMMDEKKMEGGMAGTTMKESMKMDDGMAEGKSMEKESMEDKMKQEM